MHQTIIISRAVILKIALAYGSAIRFLVSNYNAQDLNIKPQQQTLPNNSEAILKLPTTPIKM